MADIIDSADKFLDKTIDFVDKNVSVSSADHLLSKGIDKADNFISGGGGKKDDPSVKAREKSEADAKQQLADQKKRVANNPEDYQSSSTFSNLGALFQTNEDFKAFDGFKPALEEAESLTKFKKAAKEQFSRENVPPQTVRYWECRIGATTFTVPPVNINVSQTFAAGSLGGAIRQGTSPKFNTGHSTTMIEMTLYFPASENIWGFYGANATQANIDKGKANPGDFKIDFNKDPEDKVDFFLSSLRGLVAQFRYAPILPIRCDYINQTYGITGVGLKDISISTVEEFPFCVVVNLNLIKFNHHIYLPMVEDFDSAVHYGRLRSYLGRAISKLNQISDKQFLESREVIPDPNPLITNNILVTPNMVIDKLNEQEVKLSPTSTFNKFEDIANGKNFEIWYPYEDPAPVAFKDITTNFLDKIDPTKRKNWWQNTLGLLQIDYNTEPGAAYDAAKESADRAKNNNFVSNEYNMLNAYLDQLPQETRNMSKAKREAYVAKRLKALHLQNASENQKSEKAGQINDAWYAYAFNQFLTTPEIAAALNTQDYKKNNIYINEWEIPMAPLNLDPANVFVQSVVANTGNNFAQLQLQMHDQPTLQHIGGGDTTCEIQLIIFGESDLLKLRTAFDRISGLARLEHGHGVLGFLGIKNLLTALIGMKYVVPLKFEVDTVPGFPHVYNVRFLLGDFDIFQSKRESLSLDQQAEITSLFGKANPFLRIKQVHGLFNAYPDLPLAVRDEAGKILGYLDPDFYFRSWEVLDGGENAPTSAPPATEPNTTHSSADPKTPVATASGIRSKDLTRFYFGATGDNSTSSMDLDENGIHFVNNGERVVSNVVLDEPHAGNMINSSEDGAAPPSSYSYPYGNDAGGNPEVNGQSMVQDEVYRNKEGRMIRAFPTYMLWFVQEGGMVAGIRLYDNFYGLQSVTDLSVLQSEDILGDTMVVNISNLYSKLGSGFKFFLDENSDRSDVNVINTQINRQLNAITGTTDFLLQLDSADIRPGMRVHLRVGYGSDPANLDTIFNGVITNVQMGETIQLTCQSDAIELGALVNTSNKDGHSGKVDGTLTGLYMSEPRDLMITLLTMGASTFKDAIAWASRGAVFSENRFGIRHFGVQLWNSSDPDPAKKQRDRLATAMGDASQAAVGGSIIGFVNLGIRGLTGQMWTNFALKKDYEIFKRNIYPGNGTGIDQFLGGDIGDIGLDTAMAPTGVQADGTLARDPITGQKPNPSDPPPGGKNFQPEPDNKEGGKSILSQVISPVPGLAAAGFATSHIAGPRLHNFASMLGITGEAGGEDRGGDEVSFRAQTFNKNVWDLFIVCAGLLPNYIVAVRPFEHRSTVFYGKPHWNYTSGVIPVTYGASAGNGPKLEGPDEEYQKLLNELEKAISDRDNGDPIADAAIAAANKQLDEDIAKQAGAGFGGVNDPRSLPDTHPTSGAKLRHKVGPVVKEMHLPTTGTHHQLAELPENEKYPYYMDRIGGTAGGSAPNTAYTSGGAVKVGDNPNAPGVPGAFGDLYGGLLDPVSEQWYCCQLWDEGKSASQNQKTKESLKGKRIMVFNPNANRAVICTPGDWGPGARGGSETGVSPDTYQMLGRPGGDVQCTFGFVDDGAPLGPYDMSQGVKTISNNDPPVSGSADSKVNAETSLKALTWLPPGETDPNRYSLEHGYRPHENQIPVNYSRDPKEQSYEKDLGLPADKRDRVGEGAEAYYRQAKNTKDNGQANDIWDEFRDDFPDEGIVKAAFLKYANKTSAPGESTGSSGITPENVNASIHETPELYHQYRITLENFMRQMWQDSYSRGWLVATTDGQLDGISVDNGVDTAKTIVNAGERVIGFGLGLPDKATDTLTLSKSRTHNWNFDSAHAAWDTYLQNNLDFDAVKTYMKDNDTPGDLSHDIGSKIAGKINDLVFKPIANFFKAIGTFVLGSIGSIINSMRAAMLIMSNGLSMISNMQKRTNVLNRIYNDSRYFAAGAPGSAAYFIDNPFTREFGEPVIEIRQPFQRLHTLDSFSNIISNNIQENSDGVNTVVTATSNNKHPVTVHFDKSAPSEYQKEQVIETGLFFDAPKGFSRIFHPIQGLRAAAQAKGESGGGLLNRNVDQIHAKNIALYYLKESLKDIYMGEMVILGDANIRPHDLLYINDVYEKIQGICEVEQVVHHFTPETGFITSITPNALVSINDPGRWLITTRMRNKKVFDSIKRHLRESLKVRIDANGNDTSVRHADGTPFTMKQLASRVDTIVENSPQYLGGWGSLVKDMAGLEAMGGFGGVAVGAGAGAVIGSVVPGPGTAIGAVVGGVGGAIGGAMFGWDIWKKVRDNLLDQHGCYIQYLTHNGQPMDAGISTNGSVSVGQKHGISIMLGGLGVAKINTKENGDGDIDTQDLLRNLGWNEVDTLDANSRLDSFQQKTWEQLLDVSGKSVDGLPGKANLVVWARVIKVIDGDTFDVSYLEGDYQGLPIQVRMGFGDTEEFPYKTHRYDDGSGGSQYQYLAPSQEFLDTLPSDAPGLAAYNYTRSKIEGKNIAMRIIPTNDRDQFDRTIGYVFNGAPAVASGSEEVRKQYLMAAAGGYPTVSWDSFNEDGEPFTLNKDLYMKGLSRPTISVVTKTLPNSGVHGAG